MRPLVSFAQTLQKTLSRCVGVDLRALALFRVGLGIIVLADLIIRAFDLEAFHTDFGILPRNIVLEKFSNPFAVSLLFANGQMGYALLYFAVTALCSLFLIVGWKTRFFSFAVWVLFVGLGDRFPGILQGGDILLRLLLFWSMFVPMHAVWSVDASLDMDRSHVRKQVSNYSSLGTLGLLLQVACLYVFTSLLKTGIEWKDGSAVHYALYLDHFVTHFGKWLRTFSDFTAFATKATIKIELLAPIFFFVPFFRDFFRGAVFIALAALHVVFWLCLDVSLFAWTDIVALLPLLPSTFFDCLQRRLVKDSAAQTTIFFDGPCGFCKKAVYILRELLLPDNITIREAQSEMSALSLMQEKRSWIVSLPDGSMYSGFSAFQQLLNQSRLTQFLAKIFSLQLLSRTGERCYRFVADHRERLSKYSAVYLPYDSIRLRPRFFENVLIVFSMCFIILWNARGIENSGISLPQWMIPYGRILHLDQYWNMFAPFPMKDDGWYVLPGKLANGTPVDVWNKTAGEPSRQKPDHVADMYPNFRWTKFMVNIWSKSMSEYRLYFGRYLCRTWNRDVVHEDLRLKTFEIIYMREDTLPDREADPVPVSIWSHACF